MSKIAYKNYNVVVNGMLVGTLRVPAVADNCWWFDIQLWSPITGWVRRAERFDNGDHFMAVES